MSVFKDRTWSNVCTSLRWYCNVMATWLLGIPWSNSSTQQMSFARQSHLPLTLKAVVWSLPAEPLQACSNTHTQANDIMPVQEAASADGQEEMSAWFQQALGVRCCLVRQRPGSRKPITRLQPGRQNDQDSTGHLGDLLQLHNRSWHTEQC